MSQRSFGRRVPRLAFCVSALAFATAVSCASAADYRRLSGEQIRERLLGHEVGDGLHWRDHFYPGGSVAGYVSGMPNPGAWRIDADTLCITRWEVRIESPECFQVWAAGDEVQYRDGDTTFAVGSLHALPGSGGGR
jgi:hypothetical protein